METGPNFANAGIPTIKIDSKAIGNADPTATNASPTAANMSSDEIDSEDSEYEPPQPDTTYSCAEKQARSAAAVEIFRHIHALQTQIVAVPMAPLRFAINANTDFQIWQLSIVLLLLQHGVYGAIDPDFHPLRPDHELYSWYVLMVDIACALIWNNLSAELKANRWIRFLIFQKMLVKLMQSLTLSFGEGCEFKDINTVIGDINIRGT
ncbi:uncharacterized protein N7511_002602 [Penicillium nucicola]|uniref:uncharacterized protein n=1 Tax=Penicillium nucicola TaxID=1850975 RepID=UPI0025458325|nr:uncharacterized protein N7511_002602 [Penicillium nucicola]KAJ5770551.1 hypothetical protein N7511_002602 [Penicillium nucicola]